MRQQEIFNSSNGCISFENVDREMDHSVSKGGFPPTHALSQPAAHASGLHEARTQGSSDEGSRWFQGVCVYRLAYRASYWPQQICHQQLSGDLVAMYLTKRQVESSGYTAVCWMSSCNIDHVAPALFTGLPHGLCMRAGRRSLQTWRNVNVPRSTVQHS